MDRAVLDAYGWTDLRPDCEFLLDYAAEETDDDTGTRRREKPWRYRWPGELRGEVLARLLVLNQARAHAERLAAPKPGAKAPRSAKQRRRSSVSSPGPLFGEYDLRGSDLMSRRYLSPPVFEALCEIYTAESAWDPTIPGRFYERVREDFPRLGQTREMGVEIASDQTGQSARVTQGEARSQFLRKDGSRMLQLAPDLVVVNQLRPYPTFEDWKPQILEALDHYRALAKPNRVQRVGLRYLNRVVIPAEGFRMERYFRLYPEIPKALGTEHGSFMLRIEIPVPARAHNLLVTFGTAPREGEAGSAFLLDLYDTVPEREFDAVARRIDEAHDHIERTFEAILTDETRTLFEENANGR